MRFRLEIYCISWPFACNSTLFCYIFIGSVMQCSLCLLALLLEIPAPTTRPTEKSDMRLDWTRAWPLTVAKTKRLSLEQSKAMPSVTHTRIQESTITVLENLDLILRLQGLSWLNLTERYAPRSLSTCLRDLLSAQLLSPYHVSKLVSRQSLSLLWTKWATLRIPSSVTKTWTVTSMPSKTASFSTENNHGQTLFAKEAPSIPPSLPMEPISLSLIRSQLSKRHRFSVHLRKVTIYTPDITNVLAVVPAQLKKVTSRRWIKTQFSTVKMYLLASGEVSLMVRPWWTLPLSTTLPTLVAKDRTSSEVVAEIREIYREDNLWISRIP